MNKKEVKNLLEQLISNKIIYKKNFKKDIDYKELIEWMLWRLETTTFKDFIEYFNTIPKFYNYKKVLDKEIKKIGGKNE